MAKPYIAAELKVNRTQIDRAMRRMFLVSARAPANIVNQASARVNQKATWNMKAVSRDTISKELQAYQQRVRTRLKSGRLSKGRKKLFFGPSDGSAPLLALIIQSRGKSPWKGVSRQEGADRMLEEMRRVFGARMKSRAFFKACFATLRDIFRRAAGNRIPFSDSKSRGSGTQESVKRDAGRIAKGSPAKEAQGKAAVAKFQILSPKHDIKGAIYEYAQPVLQKAFDEEAQWIFKKAAELEYKEAAKLAGIRTS